MHSTALWDVLCSLLYMYKTTSWYDCLVYLWPSKIDRQVFAQQKRCSASTVSNSESRATYCFHQGHILHEAQAIKSKINTRQYDDCCLVGNPVTFVDCQITETKLYCVLGRRTVAGPLLSSGLTAAERQPGGQEVCSSWGVVWSWWRTHTHKHTPSLALPRGLGLIQTHLFRRVGHAHWHWLMHGPPACTAFLPLKMPHFSARSTCFGLYR